MLEKFEFKSEPLEKLRETVGKAVLTKAVLDLLVGMVDKGSVGEKLLQVIEETKGKSEGEVGYVGGNVATVLVKVDKAGLEGKDLSGVVVKGADFTDTSLLCVNFQNTTVNFYQCMSWKTKKAYSQTLTSSSWFTPWQL